MSKARQLADLGNVYDDGALSNRNLIINGAMQVAQRGTSSTSTANTSYHTVDRFNFRGQSTGVYTIAQDTDAPTDFNNSTKITVTTPDATIASGERYWVASYLEGNTVSSLNFGSSNAKTVTLSFYVKSSLTGTFSGGLVNSAFDRAYAFTYVISSANTWEKKTITIAGDTSGTWLTNNGIGISVVWDLGAATNRQQSAGAWTASGSVSATGASHVIATNNATWQITGVQMELGDTATPFEHRSYGDELARCQRYFQLYPEETTVTGSCYNSDPDWYFPFVFPEMRAAPTVTFSDNPLLFCNDANSGTTSVTSSSNNDNRKSIRLQAQNAAVGSAGQAGWLQMNVANSYFTLDAEL